MIRIRGVYSSHLLNSLIYAGQVVRQPISPLSITVADRSDVAVRRSP